ncbi:Rieske 2Fe-2S domain-containing protein [Acuticoccus sp. MNP-M23]|uniref:Rieske 2Fe-2S domain-containing protein n=1 Tax=Acuticoccus sp. MNP-M23 TaxID=3072793 RepID=UPI0028161CC6|nr:Rieske 2Fe-2S domain-containing protein [Acuticoccus sp. MNP-M23]WMS44718.1 Rieske 2Fe-2S domain-containing protein [Acuticoccus sp. MNP-M23]
MASERQWWPVAASDEVVPRHVFQATLLDRPLAVWRADDGTLNVWEDRCLHRGVRLTLGTNDGAELICRYHGWRYASGTAGCTYIPAHPADAPAQTIHNRIFPVREAFGLVWSAAEAPAGEPSRFDPAATLVLRPMPVAAAPADVAAALGAEIGAAPAGLHLAAADGTAEYFIQAAGAGRSIIRGLAVPEGAALAQLARHNAALSGLRDAIEATAPPVAISTAPALAPAPPGYDPGAPGEAGRATPLRLRVAERTTVADGIVQFRLTPVSGQLPTAQPGAHIDLALPGGITRQYSLLNGPGETAHYAIAVKRDPASRGGSAALHDRVRVGDVLAASRPHNSFPLRRDAVATRFVAGGIGLTPLVAMARALARAGAPFAFHHFVRTEGELAFRKTLAALGPYTPHVGHAPAAAEAALNTVLAAPETPQNLYLCGPPAMLDAARRIAAANGWPEARVHFEYFANEMPATRAGAFTVALARSALTVPVREGETILAALRGAGVPVESSCEQGACGTCVVRVLEGMPLHQDVCLSAAEREDHIATCVSRASSARLVLDL